MKLQNHFKISFIWTKSESINGFGLPVFTKPEIGKGRVAINDQTIKASREVKVGDTVKARQGDITRTVKVLAISDQRGPAPIAQALYEETHDSLELRDKISVQRRLSKEPALSIEQGRPTKRNRRDLEKAKQVGWNDRWSASLDTD